MSEERIKTAQITLEDLCSTIYSMSVFAEMLRDIFERMPFQENDEDYHTRCQVFCREAYKKMDVLTLQLELHAIESNQLVEILEGALF